MEKQLTKDEIKEVAKLFKVRVNEFALGMGPAIFKKKKGDTTYALRLLPIGGYVSMEGEDEESNDENSHRKRYGKSEEYLFVKYI